MTEDPYAPRKGKSPHGDYPAWIDQLVEVDLRGGHNHSLVKSNPLQIALDHHVSYVFDALVSHDIREFLKFLSTEDPEMSARFAAFRARRRLLGE